MFGKQVINMTNREIQIGERTYTAADEQTWIRWKITQEVDRIAESLPPERQPYYFKPIVFDEEYKPRGLTVIFHAGSVCATSHLPGALFVPERSLKILDALGISYRVVSRQEP